MVANTSNRIREIPAEMTSSSTRLSWLGRFSVELSGRWEVGVNALMDVVAVLMALVSSVSSVPIDARAASVSRAEELLDRVHNVASKIRG
jgi:hypothetical protein